jgi:hypothetical protein
VRHRSIGVTQESKKAEKGFVATVMFTTIGGESAQASRASSLTNSIY